MGSDSCIPVKFASYPYISGAHFTGILFKWSDNYGVVFAANYAGECILIKRRVAKWEEPIWLSIEESYGSSLPDGKEGQIFFKYK